MEISVKGTTCDLLFIIPLTRLKRNSLSKIPCNLNRNIHKKIDPSNQIFDNANLFKNSSILHKSLACLTCLASLFGGPVVLQGTSADFSYPRMIFAVYSELVQSSENLRECPNMSAISLQRFNCSSGIFGWLRQSPDDLRSIFRVRTVIGKSSEYIRSIFNHFE